MWNVINKLTSPPSPHLSWPVYVRYLPDNIRTLSLTFQSSVGIIDTWFGITEYSRQSSITSGLCSTHSSVVNHMTPHNSFQCDFVNTVYSSHQSVIQSKTNHQLVQSLKRLRAAIALTVRVFNLSTANRWRLNSAKDPGLNTKMAWPKHQNGLA